MKAGSSISGGGYMRLRMKKPAPQQKSTPIMRRNLGAGAGGEGQLLAPCPGPEARCSGAPAALPG